MSDNPIIVVLCSSLEFPKDSEGNPYLAEENIGSREFAKNIYGNDYGRSRASSLWERAEEEANTHGATITGTKEIKYETPEPGLTEIHFYTKTN